MNKRRRLLAALASVPSVVTLPTTQSYAISSATCLDKPDSYTPQGGLTASCLTSLGVNADGELING